MKICYITVRRYTESPEAQEYIRNLAALGVDCDLIYRLEGNEPLLQLATKGNVDGIAIPHMNQFSFAKSYKFIRAALEKISHKHYDVVHVAAFRGCFLLPILGRKISKTWLMDIRTSNVTASGLKAKLADLVTVLESKAFTNSIVISEELGRVKMGVSPCVVVTQGADIERFRQGQREITRQQLNFAPDDKVIIYIGAMGIERNPFQILETFALVATTHPTSKLLMVGDSKLRPSFEKWAQDHNLAHRIIFTGRIPYDDVQNYVAAADIGFAYVPVTPNYEYNPPLKTVEFLAASLPTVATNTAGSRVYVQHEHNALLAPDDPASLAQAIRRILDDKDLLQRLAANAYPSVKEYDWQTIVQKQLLPLYQHYASL